MRGIGIVILAVFYGVYIVKMILQRRKGIRTDQIARGKPRGRLFWTELTMKIAAYLAVAAEVISIFAVEPALPRAAALCGAALGLAGDLIFAAAVLTMRDSWRAGIAEQDKTELITQGIYQISRNPAFLGFDCVYIGLTLMFLICRCWSAPCLPWLCSICKSYRRSSTWNRPLAGRTFATGKRSTGILAGGGKLPPPGIRTVYKRTAYLAGSFLT